MKVTVNQRATLTVTGQIVKCIHVLMINDRYLLQYIPVFQICLLMHFFSFPISSLLALKEPPVLLEINLLPSGSWYCTFYTSSSPVKNGTHIRIIDILEGKRPCLTTATAYRYLSFIIVSHLQLKFLRWQVSICLCICDVYVHSLKYCTRTSVP